MKSRKIDTQQTCFPALFALVLVLSVPAYAGPLAWLDVAGKLETGENILLFVAGAVSMCVLWALLTCVKRHYKVVLAVSALLAAIALLVQALRGGPLL